VLAGGRLRSYALPELAAVKTWPHAKGTACDLDVSDDGKRALVLRDRKLVEVIDLVKKKRLGDWTRKGRNVDAVGVGFGRKGEILSVCDEEFRLSRVKDTTGRMTGELLWLDSPAKGPIRFDGARRFAAIGLNGEDIEVVELTTPARAIFNLDPRITVSSEKSLAALKRIPTFKALAPGFFARHGSVEAPPSPDTLTAHAVSETGLLAAGFVAGDLVVADMRTGAVVSSHRGALSEGRERARIAVSDVARTVVDGHELWVLKEDRRFVVFDLEDQTRREGPTIELQDEDQGEGELSAAVGTLELTRDRIVAVDKKRVLVWSRKDGALLARRELPENKGAHLDPDDGARLLLLPISSLGHEGFDICEMDLATGATKVVCRFDRDAERFPLGNQPQGWVAFGRAGTTPTITIWAGAGLTIAQVFAFDLATGKLGRPLGSSASAGSPDGALSAEPDFSNPLQPGDGVKVTNLATGEEILRCPYEPTDSPRTGTAAFDPETRYVAALVGDPAVAVWRPNARRLILDGHRDANALLLRAKSLVSWDRFWLRLWDVSGD
jgi:hypothetical protein